MSDHTRPKRQAWPGTVVMDEQIYYIRDIRFYGGLVHIDAVADGPIDFPGGKTEFAIHGEDGTLILTANDVMMHPMHATEGGRVYADFTIAFADRTATPVADPTPPP